VYFVQKDFIGAEDFRYKSYIKRNPLVSQVVSRSLLRELRYKPTIYEPTVTRKVLFFYTRNIDAAGFSQTYVPHYTVFKHSDILCWAQQNQTEIRYKVVHSYE
jgi:hypothetical protein